MKLFSKRIITLATTALIATASFYADAKKPNVMDISKTITDEAIVFPESFEVSTQKLLEGWYMRNYTATDDRYRKMPDVPVSDEVITARLQAIPAVIEMPFNPIVRKYIERYTKHGRAQVAAMLGLGNYYMPIFEQALEKEGLPLELKYLPVIESALDPNAVSRSGAAGLWQFILSAAKGLGLEVNSLVDERRDPYLSSATAAKFLKDLYATYGDWSLVIAAYNCGPGTVNKAIRRAGGDPKTKDFWQIYNYLPSETRGYVPAFIAANYVMNYYRDHNISPVLATKPLITDTIGITQRVHFDQISHVLNIPVEELRVLNPQFRADVIPGRPDAPYFLILPSQQIHAYIMSENDILAYNAAKYQRQVTASPGQTAYTEPQPVVADPQETAAFEQDMAEIQQAVSETTNPDGSKTIKHKVQPQESLASIAQHYGVSPEQVKEWNNLRRNAIRVGQQLTIYTGGTPTVAQNAPATPSRKQETAPSRSRRQNTHAVSQPEPAQEQPAQQTQPQKQAQKPAKKPKANVNEGRETAQQSSTRQSKKDRRAQKDTTKQDTKKDSKKNRKKDKKKNAKPAQPTTVSVRNGDSLDRIARQQGVSVDALRKANPNLTGKNPTIHPGQKINLPKKDSDKKTSKGKKNNKKEETSSKKNKKSSDSKKKDSKKKRR